MANKKPRYSKRSKKTQETSRMFLTFAGGILLILLMVAGLLTFNAKNSNVALPIAEASTNQDPEEKWNGLVRSVTDLNRRFKGSPDAPVTILEFSDFQ